jgi:hypothetical protein
MIGRLLRFLAFWRCRHRDLMGWVRYWPDIGQYRRCGACGERVPVAVRIEHRVFTKVTH